MGKSEKNNKDKYISNQLNPLFGECFELQATLPHDYKLKIKVMDHDVGSLPDLIGETTIDLENRWLSKHRATCGISEAYFRLDNSRLFSLLTSVHESFAY